MNKRYFVIAAAFAMLALIAAAVALDCVRLAAQARHRVELADQELAKHEQRLVTLLQGSPALSPEVQAAIVVYHASAGAPARHAAFDKLIAAFRQTMQISVDPTDSLNRKFMDDVAGAINRHERAMPPYEAEVTDYQAYLNGPRGTVARWFSQSDRDNWNAK